MQSAFFNSQYISGEWWPFDDIVAPVVAFTAPATLETNIVVNSNIYIVFSEAMDPTTITNSTIVVTTSGNPVSGTLSVDGPVVTFTPDNPLLYLTTYDITITTGVKDLAGNPMAGSYIFSFVTQPRLDVELLDVDCWANDLIVLTFSNQMLNNTALRLAFNYVITSDQTILPIIYDIDTGVGFSTDRVSLYINQIIQGAEYTVSVFNLRSTDLGQLTTGTNHGSFVGRRTKIDNMLSHLPNFYHKSMTKGPNGSIIRKLINAIGRQDDELGGSKKD